MWHGLDLAALALRLLQAKRDDVQSAQALMETMGLRQLVQTEPDAKDMRTSRGPRIAYNVQTAVDAKHALILHHDVTDEGTDNRQRLPVDEAAKAMLEQETLNVVADAGYSSLTQFQACEDADITALCRPIARKITRGTARCLTVPASSTTPSVMNTRARTTSVLHSSRSTLTTKTELMSPSLTIAQPVR